MLQTMHPDFIASSSSRLRTPLLPASMFSSLWKQRGMKNKDRQHERHSSVK